MERYFMREINNFNMSRFILPFYFVGSKKDAALDFSESDWLHYSVNTRYLTKSVYELFCDSENSVCKCYSLNDSARVTYGIPARDSLITMESSMKACEGTYQFYLAGHKAIVFNSGIGFLILEVTYPSDELDKAADIGFCLANLFDNEHDNSERNNNLIFKYNDKGVEHSFSVKNTVMQLLNVEKHADTLELFPSSTRRRMLVYHSIVSSDQKDTDEKDIHCLCRAMHSHLKHGEEDISLSSFEGQKWLIGSTGAVSYVQYDDSNEEFVTKSFKRNVETDYFYIFVLALHEREVLLQYNYAAVKNQNDVKALIGMKEKLLKLDILYTFKTVSIEKAYQIFYEKLSEEFILEELRADIKDVVDSVENHVNNRKDRKTNIILTALSVLAVFSVLTDGVSFVDRLLSGDPMGALQWGVVGVVGLGVIVAVIMMRKK